MRHSPTVIPTLIGLTVGLLVEVSPSEQIKK